jgi:hypothetical protein
LVIPRDGECGEEVPTLDEAIALAEGFVEPGLGPIDVIELRGKGQRVVWSSAEPAWLREELLELD